MLRRIYRFSSVKITETEEHELISKVLRLRGILIKYVGFKRRAHRPVTLECVKTEINGLILGLISL